MFSLTLFIPTFGIKSENVRKIQNVSEIKHSVIKPYLVLVAHICSFICGMNMIIFDDEP